MSPEATQRPIAALALLFNAMVWGLSWWPLRQLQAAGLHPLWSTVLIFALAVLVIGLMYRQAWRELPRRSALWGIALAAGTTNACFNWGVTAGDVVRVVLLFYLMPLWAVLLARWLLHEAITAAALQRVALALGGAALVLWPEPVATASSAWRATDGLGLLGGFSFALNNVLLRREASQPDGASPGARAVAMFAGGCLVSLALALAGALPPPPAPAAGWLLGVLALGGLFIASNLALQYGASRLAAGTTAVLMVTEVAWATASAVALSAGQVTPRLLAGGGLILAAAVLAARRG